MLNGAGYDAWAENVVETLDDEPVVVSAAEVADVDGRRRPHLWYDPAIVEQMSGAITEALIDASPGAGPYLADRAGAWEAELQPYRDAIGELRAVAAGRNYAATETVFDRMAAAVGLTDLTPAGNRRAVSNESEPTPGDVADFDAVLSGGEGRRPDGERADRGRARDLPDVRGQGRRGRVRRRHGMASPRPGAPSSRGRSRSWRNAP